MFKNIKNNIDFFIRNNTKFSRKNYKEKNKKLAKLIEAENLNIEKILEKYFKKISKKQIRILDIGSKNWSYAKGEHDFFKSFCNDFELIGVELDAYRLYANFYSRYEVAKFYTQNLENTKYIPDNLLNIKGKFDYITWFLPFIIKDPLIFWGLPLKYFCPEKMLSHAYSLLNISGQMLIINQGETEKEMQEKLLQKLNIPFNYLGEIENKYYKYKNKRYGFLIYKR